MPTQLDGIQQTGPEVVPSSGVAGRVITALVSSNGTVSSPVATNVVLDPWRNKDHIFGDARLTSPASTAASRKVKLDDSAGKPHSGGVGYGTTGARGRSAKDADPMAEPQDSPSSFQTITGTETRSIGTIGRAIGSRPKQNGTL